MTDQYRLTIKAEEVKIALTEAVDFYVAQLTTNKSFNDALYDSINSAWKDRAQKVMRLHKYIKVDYLAFEKTIELLENSNEYKTLIKQNDGKDNII